MRCPNPERLAAYLDVVLSTPGTAEMLLHFAGCPRCRSVVETVIHGFGKDPLVRGPATPLAAQTRTSRVVLPFNTSSRVKQ